MPHLLDQVEAVGPHRLPHLSSPAGSAEQLAPVEVKPQIPVRYHPQVAFTLYGKDHRDGDSIGGKMLELDGVVVAEPPHEATRGRTESVAVELD